MKRVSYVIIAVALLLFLTFVPVFPPDTTPALHAVTSNIKACGFMSEDVVISAEKAILVDKTTGLVLYAKNADSPSGMASTTKIMTAIVVLENMLLSEEIEITKESVGIEGSSIYLSEGEIFTVESLLYGLLLESGNDAACALAIGCCGSIEKFSNKMNDMALKIGMSDSNFTNPHGLSDSSHFTTARDMSILASYAMNNETFRNIVSTQKKSIKPLNGEYVRFCTNHNKLLWNYDGITGIKTGYTKADGRCLVTSAMKDETELICVTLNSPDNWNDHRVLLNKGFEMFKKRTLAQKGEYAFDISVVGGEKNFVTCQNISNITIPIPENASIDFKVVTPSFIYAPVKAGDFIGEVRIYNNQKLIYSFPLCATFNVEVKKISFFKKIFG